MLTKTKRNDLKAINTKILLQNFYSALHAAYNSMLKAFRKREEDSGFSQESIAILLNVDKALISRRLRGIENLTLRSLSYMATALNCRLIVKFEPNEEIVKANYPGKNYLKYTASNASAGKFLLKPSISEKP